MGIFNFFHKKKDESPDWRKPEAIPKEVLSKKELDDLEHQVIAELRENDTLHPQALFYIHKYIDAKFNKRDFDVDTAYAKKQNVIDELYAEGLSDIYSSFTGYKGLVDEITAARENLERIAKSLDMDNAEVDTREYDDTEEIFKEIESLPTSLNWSTKKGDR